VSLVAVVLFPEESSLNFTERPVTKMFQHTKKRIIRKRKKERKEKNYKGECKRVM
jgi:hypothetical protein